MSFKLYLKQKKRTLYVVTAFIGKKGYKNEASQLINAKSPDVTAETGSVVTSNNIIPNSAENVKQKGDFSLSSKDTAPKKHGDYAVYGEDVMLEGEAKPTGKREFTAPTRESIAEMKHAKENKFPMLDEDDALTIRKDVNSLKTKGTESEEILGESQLRTAELKEKIDKQIIVTKEKTGRQ